MKSLTKNKSFTIIELLVYIAVLVVITTAVSGFIIWSINSNSKAKVMRQVLNNSRRAVEIITSEIKEATEIYTPTTTFSSHPGQLSLKTLKYLPTGEQVTYIDFYLCEDWLCLKKESQDPIVLTSDKVKVTNLVFQQVASNPPSIQIDLTVEFADISGRPEHQATVTTSSVASLRKY